MQCYNVPIHLIFKDTFIPQDFAKNINLKTISTICTLHHYHLYNNLNRKSDRIFNPVNTTPLSLKPSQHPAAPSTPLALL